MSCPGYILATVRCKKLTVVTLVGGCRCDLDLTFDLVVVTLTYKILFRLYLGNCKVGEVDSRDIFGGCRYVS